jgi:hypothetical protein
MCITSLNNNSKQKGVIDSWVIERSFKNKRTKADDIKFCALFTQRGINKPFKMMIFDFHRNKLR